ncbi:Rep [uncultured virus]|uniref:Rep n=1 Tax=uncultured virus TaxID=340016 RepID=A0A2K9LS60_9VIRU|nr:Rep [uncultured virus]
MDELTDLLTDLKDLEEGPTFRMQNQKMLYTYKHHICKAQLACFFKKFAIEIKSLYIVHEVGEKTGYKHTHVAVDFGKPINTRDCTKFDFKIPEEDKPIHPHMRYAPNRMAWLKIVRYVTKFDKSILEDMHPADRYNIVDRVLNSTNLQEAYHECHKLSDVMGCKTLFETRPLDLNAPARIDINNLWPWQTQVRDKLMTPPDQRTVLWLYDKVGKSGKTVFADAMEVHYPSKCLYFDEIGRTCDFTMNLHKEITNGWRGDTIFFNLVRSQENKESKHLYKILEKCKDGRFTGTKYNGGRIRLPFVHVVVLANFMPDIDSMSKDRWAIYAITNKVMQKVPIGVEWPEMSPKPPEGLL